MLRQITLEEFREHYSQIQELFDEYLEKIGRDKFATKVLLDNLGKRLEDESLHLIVWDDEAGEGLAGFALVSFQRNFLNLRSEAVIWHVYNRKPQADIRQKVIEEIENIAKQYNLEAVVFFSDNPVAMERIVEPFGYRLTLGYFEKILKGA